MSYSWVDPHFAALYARREEERLAERLATRLRERAACEPILRPVGRREPSWFEHELELHHRIRLL